MAISSFIPKVWSKKILDGLNRALILGALCGRDYEDDVAEYGDTVHIGTLSDATVRPYTRRQAINAAEPVNGTDKTLTIDHSVYAHVSIDDITAAQARADLLEAVTRMVGRRLAEDTEGYLEEVIIEEAGVTGSIDASGDLAQQVASIKDALDSMNAPRIGRSLVVPPSMESALMGNAMFQAMATAPTPKAAELGALYRFAGFDIYKSSDLTDQVFALTPGAVQLAQKIVTEIYRPELALATCVKAYSLAGAKVVLPSAVACYYIS